MAAYVIFIRESAVRDTAAMTRYRETNRDHPPEPRPTPLVAYGALEALEGTAPDGVVVLRFESIEDARAWYRSPAYQAVIAHRRRAADYRAFIVEGL
jgi:uncharacterized protein (DUF1330 family)